MHLDDSYSESESSFNKRSNVETSASCKKTKIVLVKGIPKLASPEDLKASMSPWGRVNRLVKKPFTNHYYLEFEVNYSLFRLWMRQTS